MKINYTCQICGKECSSFKGMFRHIRIEHKMYSKEYYDKFYKKLNEGKCIVCGKQTKYVNTIEGYRRYCSVQCNHSTDEFKNSVREGMKNSEHWQKIRNTEEFRKKLSEGHKNGNYVQKVMKTKEYRDNMRNAVLNSEKWLNAQQDPERRYKLSVLATKRIENGEMKLKYKYDEKTFSSSYELAYYIWLKDSKKDFIYQADPIPYEFNGVTKHYVPDFKVDDQLIEIKGIHFFENKDPNGKMICPWKRKNDTEETIKHRNELFETKHQCMLRYNVIIITDCSLYIEYVKTHYGEDYLSQFRV